MRVIVPTFEVKAILRETVVVGTTIHGPGTIVPMAYGIALQALAQRVIGAIVDADNAHSEALLYIAKYGADSWFPRKLQTISLVMADVARAEEESKLPETVKH